MILGIWDGHDSGAALVENGRIIAAVNEERFTRRKMEVLFPKNSILFCLNSQNLSPNDIEDIAYSTSDFSLTLTRNFPKIKDNYYYVRRRLKKAGFPDLSRKTLNITGRLKSNRFFQTASNRRIKKELRHLGFQKFNLHLVDHHKAHTASAYITSGMKNALTITMDGLGDGLSATVSICKNNQIERIKQIPTRDSLGLFYQEVTSLLKMRILEDEGKVMCLADYSLEIPKQKNPMLNLFDSKDSNIRSKISLNSRYNTLKHILKNTSKERFSRMAQDALEHHSLNFFQQLTDEIGIKNICLAGGIFANIKNNMNIINSLNIKNWFVFPHMGDGGLAAGAALFIDNHKNSISPYQLKSVSLGPEYSEQEILNTLNNYKNKLSYQEQKDISGFAADNISRSKIIYWFQGKMEFGPRALGNRSILALPSKKQIRDRLNKLIKRRDWYQPFCPAILDSEAKRLFHPFSKPDQFMTMGYQIKENNRKLLAAVQSTDGSCRPQIIPDSKTPYSILLKKLKNKTGTAAVLNTSFNIHGYPLVNSPEDAIKTLLQTKQGTLIIGNFTVELK